MTLLTAAVPQGQPDYVALAIVLMLAIAVTIMAIRKSKAKKSGRPVISAAPASNEVPRRSPAPGAAGQVKLYNVDPGTAAMLMAITACKTGKPLNELRFLSIREVQQNET